MSATAELKPGEVPLLPPQSEFGGLLETVQKKGYPAFLGWSQELAENTHGYIVQARGTRRVLAVIEQIDQDGSQWLGQTFRVRRDAEEPVLFEEVCRQMMGETTGQGSSKQQILDLLQTLYLGCGMSLQYATVVLECNSPMMAEGSGDADSWSFSGTSHQEVDYQPEILDLGEIVRKALIDTKSGVAELAIDIATHMNDLANQIMQVEDELTVYRTRFQNYPWAADEHGPLVQDLVLIKVNDGSVWYMGAVEFGTEVNAVNVDSFRDYGNQLLGLDVPSAVVEGITTRIKNTRGEKPPAFLMIDLLSGDSTNDLEIEEIVGNPYDFLEEPAG